MTAFETALPTLIAQSDAHLGDSVSYDAGAGPIAGFIGYLSNASDEDVLDGRSPLRTRWSLKFAKTQIAGKPLGTHRIASAKLDAVYQPGPAAPTSLGSYWVIDLQKVA